MTFPARTCERENLFIEIKIPHIFYWESPKANELFLEQPTDKPKILDL